jgi:hypothetical protein
VGFLRTGHVDNTERSGNPTVPSKRFRRAGAHTGNYSRGRLVTPVHTIFDRAGQQQIRQQTVPKSAVTSNASKLWKTGEYVSHAGGKGVATMFARTAGTKTMVTMASLESAIR